MGFEDTGHDAVSRARNRGPKNSGDSKRSTEKICPFMSDAKDEVPCTEACKLYRSGKGSYSCYFMELQAISFALRPNS